ncbi:MAG: hypothetical protein ACO4AI_07490 [Prochlorothrix sp.]
MHPTTLDQIGQILDQSPQQIRIKKLLICTCYGTWETQNDRLNRVGMRDLVETVMMRSPTLDSLQYELNRVVKTLSKPVEYAHVANIIVRAMAWFYQQPTAVSPPEPSSAPLPSVPTAPQNSDEEQTGWLAAPAAQLPPPNPYQEALNQLKTHPQGDRLKKLAICACSNTWESDPQKLALASWDRLLPQILDLVPTRQHLEYVMAQIVRSLSKPQVYQGVARALIQILLPLYEDAAPLTFRDTTVPSPPPPPPVPPAPPTAPSAPPAYPSPEATAFAPQPIAPPAAPPATPAYYPPPAYSSPPAYYAEEAAEEATVVSTTPIYSAPPPVAPPPQPDYANSGNSNGEATVFGTEPIAPPVAPPPQPGYANSGYANGEATVFGTEPIAPPVAPPPQPGYATENTVFSTTPIVHPLAPSGYPGAEATETTVPDPHAYGYGVAANAAAIDPATIDPAAIESPVANLAFAAGTAPLAPTYDAFDLRIEMMKYTNPLMAKILIYSLLYEPFDLRTSDWQQLREFDLDSLIQTLYSQYQHYAELDTCLQSMANQLPDTDRAMQAAGTLLRVLKPMYLQRPGSVSTPPSPATGPGSGPATTQPLF